jgi:hypothetical protein
LTQLWVGHGASLHELETLPLISRGTTTSVALRRVQPVTRSIALNLGVQRGWHNAVDAPDYRSTQFSLGLTFTPAKKPTLAQ